MPRHLRSVLSGYPLHVRQRGINRETCFREAADYELYLGLLSELVPRSSCRVHAYVLMPNHVHLLISPGQPACASWLMKNVSQRYAQAFNRRYSRTGSMWEGRFRSSAVDSSRYLMTCQHYIELNPIRAGLVAAPHLYPWSSFRFNALAEPSLFLEPHDMYRRLGDVQIDRCNAYARSFPQALDAETLARARCSINANAPLGDDDFVRQVEMEIGRIARVVPRGRPRRAHVPPDGKKKLTPV